MPAACNTTEAGTLPANTYTAPCTATVVSESINSTDSAAHNTDGASIADAYTASIPATSSPQAAAAPTSPLKHYQVTYIQMQAANYPLPAVSKSGQEVLPSGFVAANKTGQAVPVLCGVSSLVDAGQNMLCCIALDA